MQHPDEGTIHAWLDGALPAGEAAAIEAHVASCDTCAPAVAEARGIIAASSRIVGHLDVVPGNVIPAAAPRKRTAWSRTAWPAAIAAVLVIGIGLRQSIQAPKPAPVALPNNQPAPTITPVITDSTPAIAAQRTAPPPSRRAPATVSEIRPDTSHLSTANVGAQKAAGVVVSQPTAAPLSQSRSEPQVAESRSMVSADAARSAVTRSSVGSVTAGSGAATSTAPTAAIGVSDRLADTSGFAGCYELGGVVGSTPSPIAPSSARTRAPARSTSAAAAATAPQQLPDRLALDDRFERFALTDEAAPTPGLFAVRQLDAAGRPGLAIVGAGWTLENDRAVLKNGDGRTLVTFLKSGSTIRGVTSDGERTARVISCRK
jgi:hypothetical protein